MKQPMLIKLNEQAADDSLTDLEVKSDAGIKESKLALDHATSDLFTESLRIDQDRTVASGVNIRVNWLILIDQITGKHYKLTIENGEILLSEVPA